ncbi:6-carboxytetrahydropterin synthase QueD [Oleidesulfovibrio sp.]|uniref:6-carboxytetrahydropterin synthase QueD n=1 Tax=Oleidesulfovibrio sp. TaxID=2909707 RepID=UPI003A8940CB
MPKGKWRLTVRSDFAAAHSLRNYCGKCEAMHGHNFGVEATIEGDTLTKDTELLVDFKVLKTALKEVLSKLDHTMLNEVPPFDACNPSSENLARFIYQNLSPLVQEYGVAVHSITVSEKAAQSATYMEIED